MSEEDVNVIILSTLKTYGIKCQLKLEILRGNDDSFTESRVLMTDKNLNDQIFYVP